MKQSIVALAAQDVEAPLLNFVLAHPPERRKVSNQADVGGVGPVDAEIHEVHGVVFDRDGGLMDDDGVFVKGKDDGHVVCVGC